MKRYIDAEKLKAAINDNVSRNKLFILKIIDTLQQEQPELSGYDKALLEVKSKIDEIYEETSIGLNEYDSGLYNGIAETCMRLRGFIKARLGSDEQPEADLEKEIDSFFLESYFETAINFDDVVGIARHFAEWGAIHLNARKEDEK